MKTATGEEGLECIMKLRIKLYRYRDDQWKERGIGNAKLLRDRESKRIRFLMRQEKTKKPVANFMRKYSGILVWLKTCVLKWIWQNTNLKLIFIVADKPLCELAPMANNDKAFVWSAMDLSDGEEALEKLAARFQTVDAANTFKE